jgi:predicted lipoprotein with Yx(FWY)xxD motif
MKRIVLSFSVVSASLIALLPGCTSGSTTTTSTFTPTPTQMGADAFTVKLSSDASLGNYLVDGSGRTLYYFTNDSENTSSASGQVLANWPVFYAAQIKLPSSLNAADFESITRSDGSMQTTFRKWPLYYFAQDKMPGDVKGKGVNNVWFVVDPAKFMPPKFFPLVSGWYMGQAVKYYDFGMKTPLVNGKVATDRIYVLITGKDAQGNPVFVNGQHNIIDTAPGDSGYSDLWKVVLVTVPASYQADVARSASDLAGSGYPMQETDMLVNCPVVPPGSKTETGKALTQGWYKGQKIFYFDYGANPDTTAPIWALITGMDSQENPVFVAGQHNIVDVVRGDTGYSDFWLVNLVTVPSGYVAETLKSAQAVTSSGYSVTPTKLLVNCPLV